MLRRARQKELSRRCLRLVLQGFTVLLFRIWCAYCTRVVSTALPSSVHQVVCTDVASHGSGTAVIYLLETRDSLWPSPGSIAWDLVGANATTDCWFACSNDKHCSAGRLAFAVFQGMVLLRWAGNWASFREELSDSPARHFVRVLSLHKLQHDCLSDLYHLQSVCGTHRAWTY